MNCATFLLINYRITKVIMSRVRHVRKKRILQKKNAAPTLPNTCLWAQGKKRMAGALGATAYELRVFFLKRTTEFRMWSCLEFDKIAVGLFVSSC